MKSSDRVILNVSAQYIKTIINVVLSMYSTRLILSVLGASDYGIYILVAGVVTMLSFLSSSMVVSTQRFLSFSIGKGNLCKLSSIFNDCVTIHVLIGAVLAAVLSCLTPFVFNEFIVVPPERFEIAKYVYWVVIVMLFVTLISSPFRAALISHEDIVFISILDILDGILKVLLALWLSTISYDKLLGYGFAMLFVQLFNFLALMLFALISYVECRGIKFKRISPSFMKELFPFVGWTVYSHACVIGRTQGIAVLLSRFVSIVANASFGIALQIYSVVSFISESVLNALRPQMVKAEGSGNRTRLIELSCLSSKCAFILLATIVIPVSFFIQELLAIWLEEVPEYASFFCVMVFIAALLDSSTVGLGIANQAMGNIRNYSIIVNTTKVLTLVPIYISFHFGLPLIYVAYFYCGFEFLGALIRLPILKSTAGISIRKFIENVFLSVSVPLAVYCFMLWLLKYVLSCNMFLAVPISLAIYLMSIYVFSFSNYEKIFVRDFIRRILVHKVVKS